MRQIDLLEDRVSLRDQGQRSQDEYCQQACSAWPEDSLLTGRSLKVGLHRYASSLPRTAEPTTHFQPRTSRVAVSEYGARNLRWDHSASFSLLKMNFSSPPFINSSCVT